MTSERSQREKAQSSMQQEDKLKCVFLIGEESSQGLIRLHGINISITTRLTFCQVLILFGRSHN